LAVVDKTEKMSARETKRLQTRERLLGAATAEFKRTGMAQADVGAIVAAAGVAHGTFFFHFPTKEHVLLELEKREEDRMAKHFGRYLDKGHDLESALTEAVRLVLGLERRLGELLFKDFLALHFSQTRPASEGGSDHSLVMLLGQRIEQAQAAGEVDPEVRPINSAVFFLLGIYALAITTNDPMRCELLEDLVKRTMHSMAVIA
jgi:AcrR family transcriptional regulator